MKCLVILLGVVYNLVVFILKIGDNCCLEHSSRMSVVVLVTSTFKSATLGLEIRSDRDAQIREWISCDYWILDWLYLI